MGRFSEKMKNFRKKATNKTQQPNTRNLIIVLFEGHMKLIGPRTNDVTLSCDVILETC